jgi:hypothetical protein
MQPVRGPMARAQLSTECVAPGISDALECRRCEYRVHTAREARRGHSRVADLGTGEHLWFGSEEPADGRPWLQVGPYGPFRSSREKPISSVCGHLWISTESGGARVLVENLSETVRIDIRSDHLPRTVPLYPVEHGATSPRERFLGTAIVALQAPESTLVLVNRGLEFPIAVRVLTTDWGPGRRRLHTMDGRRVDEPDDPTDARAAAAAHRRQQVLDGAVVRIVLGSPHHLDLLEDFLARPEVQRRLADSPTLADFLSRTKQTLHDFVQGTLDRIAAGQATHELHRLVLEGLGEPPEHQSKHYTEIVKKQLNPARELGPKRGGTGGLAELVPEVRGLWRIRDAELRTYLGLDRGPDRSPGIDV